MKRLAAALALAAACAVVPGGPAPAAAGDAPPPLENVVTWSTATEVDNFGFDVYRGTSAEGPFTRLTAEPIAGAGTSDEPHDYRFVDATIAAGQVYYYYVESISMSGERERFTPVFAAPAKGVAKDE